MAETSKSSGKYRSGFVGVLGKPNVGKSTLINTLVGHKIAAVSPRPQTTRQRQMGILTLREPPTQIIFIDTPGVHHPRHKLGELMNKEAATILAESDAIMLVIDASQHPDAEDQLLFDLVSRSGMRLPVLLVLNKVDLVEIEEIEQVTSEYQAKISSAVPVTVSATLGSGISNLIEMLLERMPLGEPFFPEDQLTDLFERDLAADLIREAALNILRDEIPHGIAVRIDQYQEREERGAYIEATLFVERESHKPIVIGQGGKMVKAIGSAARKEIEEMSQRKIFLSIKVKVRSNWRNDPDVLRRFGFR